MKLGIAISVVIHQAVGAFVFFATGGVADLPSAATRGDKLDRITLPEDLPALYESDNPTEDADPKYREALAYFEENKKALSRTNPPDDLIDHLTVLLVEAMNAGQAPEGFLDDQIAMQPVATPAYGAALEAVPDAVLRRAAKRAEAGETAEAVQAAQAVWALGERLMRNSVRLMNRRQGLVMLKGAANLFADCSEKQPELATKLEPWVPALRRFDEPWESKMAIVRVVRPHIGDLINMARNEKDLTFRLEAVLNLGVAKFNAGHRGNRRAIDETINAAKADANPLIAEAGRAAEAYTLEQVRKLS
jgi:hypothetical protein